MKKIIAEIKICYNQNHPINSDKVKEIILLNNRKWDYKRKILSFIRAKDTKKATHVLAEYEDKFKDNDKINHQFILVMRGEDLKQEYAPEEKLACCYQKAILLTIPEPEKIWNEKRPLSALEINLLLEALFYENETELHKYRVLMDYVEYGYFDQITRNNPLTKGHF